MGERGKPLVMHVEDAEDFRESFRELLECEGMRVATAEDGSTALLALGAGIRPDLMIVDLMLPRVSGEALIRIMGEDCEYAKIPVMILTAGIYARGVADLPADVPVYEKPGGIHSLAELLLAIHAVTARRPSDKFSIEEDDTIPRRTLV